MKKPVDIASLLANAAEISQRAAGLAAKGNLQDALDLEVEADRLRTKARHVGRHRRRKVDESNSFNNDMISEPEARTTGRQSVRAVTVAALSELGVPVSPRAVAEYSWARFGARIDHRSLASLRRDEWRGWSSPRSIRAVYVVPALEGRHFMAVRGKVALSDWPLERRLMGPFSERVDHLYVTIQLARQIRWLSTVEPDAAERLQALVSTYAATLPGSQDRAGIVDPTKIEEAAQAELSVFGKQDAEWRQQAAIRARQILDENQQLWGAQPLHAVAGGN
jgi:hypothetical protein